MNQRPYFILGNYKKENAIKIFADALMHENFRKNSGFGIAYPTPEQRYIFAQGMFTHANNIFFAITENTPRGIFMLSDINKKERNAEIHIHFWHRTKYMDALMEEMVLVAREDFGLDVVKSAIRADNKKALATAKAFGFQECGTIPRLFHGVDGVILYLTL